MKIRRQFETECFYRTDERFSLSMNRQPSAPLLTKHGQKVLPLLGERVGVRADFSPKHFSRVIHSSHSERAFTLLEVMIAAGIFFMCIFAILSLVSTNIRNARLLQEPQVDAGMLL